VSATPGERIIRGAWLGTAVYVAWAVAGTFIDGFVRNAAAVVSFVLFVLGVVLFFAAYAQAVSRSRYSTISVGGIYLLLGCAPGRVQVRLLGALGLQVVVAVVTSIATASEKPFTPLAFGLLVPMFGLGCCGLWGAYHGTFPARPDPRASLPADD
jgi:hypothetical protein